MSNRRRIPESLKKELIQFVKKKIKLGEYLSLSEIGSVFGISKGSVRDILIKYGIYDEYRKLSQFDHKTKSQISFYDEQVKIWKRKYNNLKKELGLEHQLIELFKQSIVPFKSNIEPIIYRPDNNQPKTRLSTIQEEPVLVISDLHYGSFVSPDETMKLNDYNPEIAKDRLLTIYEKFINTTLRIENGHIYRTVNLWLLGDIVEGIIHDELIGDVPIVDQVIEIAELLSEIVFDLSRRFEKVEVVGVIGNHGRVKKNVYFKNKYSNFDYLVYKFMETKCSNLENVNFFIPKSSMCIVQKFGKYNFLLRHGDGKSYSYAGIPVYGIIRQSSKIQQSMSAYKNLYIHYELLGHYHSNMTLPKPDGSIIVCGSLKGIDEYSFNNFLFGEPSQTMLVINEEDGVFARIDLKP